MELIYNSQTDFFELDHIYMTKYGDILTGVTTILGQTIFKDKYKSIPEYILEKAAAYGTLVHAKCEEHDIFGEFDCVEVENYIKIKKENNLIPIDNEYLVSDNERVATMIDIVFQSTDDSVHLADIKTTSKLDIDYLSWQLSICSWLFEMQNPDIKVDKLFGIWLRKEKSKLIEIDRKNNEEIEKLLDDYFDVSI